MTDAQDTIKDHRILGYDKGQQTIAQSGIDAARLEAKRLSDNQNPTLKEYGFIDGFMNAIAKEM